MVGKRLWSRLSASSLCTYQSQRNTNNSQTITSIDKPFAAVERWLLTLKVLFRSNLPVCFCPSTKWDKSASFFESSLFFSSGGLYNTVHLHLAVVASHVVASVSTITIPLFHDHLFQPLLPFFLTPSSSSPLLSLLLTITLYPSFLSGKMWMISLGLATLS